ncbi:hypothetical protein BCY86_06550 [Pajaroellobacter abortibovis]|uniref:Uncharacterized protein n=1 Tax=Pajaroellobacter abortibovis TaxID=1882918 RepID=A0A1L6MY16_9BACT|nr:hypothetical protein BCY86_06550 [Pajaroellobacter abortibovis]
MPKAHLRSAHSAVSDVRVGSKRISHLPQTIKKKSPIQHNGAQPFNTLANYKKSGKDTHEFFFQELFCFLIK